MFVYRVVMIGDGATDMEAAPPAVSPKRLQNKLLQSSNDYRQWLFRQTQYNSLLMHLAFHGRFLLLPVCLCHVEETKPSLNVLA